MISVAVDWGSSSFRAYRFDNAGQCIDQLSSASGIKFVSNNDFESVLKEQAGHWIAPGDTVLLSGMITSRNGWLESDYVECPANLRDVVSHSKKLELSDTKLLFLPGISQRHPPDVMRGEELQLLGATSRYGDSGVFIIPGTHSKWALVESKVVQKFRTVPTGELFEIITMHALIGALTNNLDWNDSVFEQGVEQGYQSATIISDLFAARSSVLLQQRAGEQAYAWLSGLLIGNEIREAETVMPWQAKQLTLIGSAQLCEKYLSAFVHLGIDASMTDDDVTVRGFQQLIQNNGLTP